MNERLKKAKEEIGCWRKSKKKERTILILKICRSKGKLIKTNRTKTKKGIEKKKIKEIERKNKGIEEKIEHKHWSIKIEVIVKKIKAEVKEEE